MGAEIVLDARTLLLAAALALPVFSWELFAMRRSVDDPVARGLSLYGIAQLLLTVGVALIGLRDSIPYELSMVGGNAAVMTACVLYLMAARRFDGRPAPARWGGLAALLSLLIMALLLMVEGHWVRVAVVTSWLALACGLTAYNLYRHANRINHPRWLTIASFAGLAAGNALRAFEALTHNESAAGLFTGSSGSIGLYLSVLVFGLASSTGFILMTADHIQQRLSFLATHDALTQARARGSFMDLAHHELRRAARRGSPVSLMMADLDFFKPINDSRGHQAGDEALRLFAHCARSALRAQDTLGRYGGDEFVVLLPDTPQADALRVAERIRSALQSHPDAQRFDQGPLTVSIGIASAPVHGLHLDELIAAADAAVYESKRQGRDRAVVAAPAA